MIRALFKYSFLLLSILSAVGLGMSRVIPNINPFEQSIIGILGLVTPVLALINLFFIFFWLIARKYFFILIPFSAIVISWKVFSVLMGGHYFCKQDFSTPGHFSLASYNVRLLDLYHWSGKPDTRNQMIDYFRKLNPSILCLQEFYNGNDSVGVDNLRAIREACGYEYAVECPVNENKRGKWGHVIFSHYPIIYQQGHDIDARGNNLLQQADILINQDTISVFNLHLKSNRFDAAETQFVTTGETENNSNDAFSKTKAIYSKLERSSINRGLEATQVSKLVSKSKHPVIICGDLNDIPSSYVYFKIRNRLQDAFLKKGKGLGATFNQRIPLLRIDYIFCSEKVKVKAFRIDPETFSDHFPLIANFEMNKKK
ncbi:MAG: endonuclease/exonuclease/phosphatase family protein [Chitinophagaceae bacterium]